MSMAFDVRHLAVVTWGLVNGGLLAAIGAEWRHDIPLPQGVAHAAPPAAVAIEPLPDFRLPPRERAFAVALERPLFVPSRRKPPPMPPPPPPPPPTMQKGQFLLVGTLITDEMKAAIVREVASGKERLVVEGFTINGLQLERVEPDRIVFTQYGDHEEIALKLQRSPKPAPKPAVAGQPPAAAPAAAASGGTGAPAWTPRALPPAGATQRPPPEPAKPMTMQDRLKNPLLKDFYK